MGEGCCHSGHEKAFEVRQNSINDDQPNFPAKKEEGFVFFLCKTQFNEKVDNTYAREAESIFFFLSVYSLLGSKIRSEELGFFVLPLFYYSAFFFFFASDIRSWIRCKGWVYEGTKLFCQIGRE